MTTLLLLVGSLLGMPAVDAAAPVAASQTVVAIGLNYLPPTVQLNAGESLSLSNLDTPGGSHSVTSTGSGEPLFTSGMVAPGAEAEVRGVTALPAGTYPFVCQVHPFMKGRLIVS